MSTVSLTARHRPQTFAEVAGQDTLKAILSRASLEGRVAPAYLFSGTRGVGKTTLARVFAKALNCRTAPTAEPCNVCDQCRAVTQGNSVDVVEIDGASNRGIDDVRRLKEVVGYAPMEGRFKIFIIDEAHMLSREAFNALLKTLEEPPARVTFIMATTEPHKFPATIISRCQHYVFKRLPENGIVAHLTSVLGKENVDFDDSAVRLIARRGAGSVRDSMSLLGQVLALGEERLTEDSTRNVLGLAGQEAFTGMLVAFREGDSLTLSKILREMLDLGLDMGFFLRELSSLWRNLFILRQSGEAGLAVVELPDEEARVLLAEAQRFALSHIHACWQMTLEGQRRVLTSLEPALALELLLLNLALLPQLISLEQLSSLARRAAVPGGGAPASGGGTPVSGGGMPASGAGTPTHGGHSASGMGAGQGGGPRAGAESSGDSRLSPAPRGIPGSPASPGATVSPGTVVLSASADSPGTEGEHLTDPTLPAPEKVRSSPTYTENASAAPDYAENAALAAERPDPIASAAPTSSPASSAPRPLPEGLAPPKAEGPPPWEDDDDDEEDVDNTNAGAGMTAAMHGGPSASGVCAAPMAGGGTRTGEASFRRPAWDEVIDTCGGQSTPPGFTALLRMVPSWEWKNETLILQAKDANIAERLQEADNWAILLFTLESLCGTRPEVRVSISAAARRVSRDDLREEILEDSSVKLLEELLGARIIDFGQLR